MCVLEFLLLLLLFFFLIITTYLFLCRMSWHDAQVVLWRPSEKVTVSNVLLMSDNFKLLKYIGAFFCNRIISHIAIQETILNQKFKKLITDYKHFSFPFFFPLQSTSFPCGGHLCALLFSFLPVFLLSLL